MRRHRTVMTDRTETITQEGAGAVKKRSSELTFQLYSDRKS